MTGNEIRETFLKYFERQGHTRVRSSPLLPANDPTLLFTNAGMNQFKDVFLGSEKRDYVRACSSQKCLRAGGKHNDLDEVGKTARHQTFFEMLGNFSFGDYFKEDAIKFAWDLLVNEYKLDPSRMWFSVFEGDDQVGPDEEAEKFWEQVGAPRERILRFDRKDNFWQMGDTGPCGPCSEIHYYMGPDPADAENCAANVNGPGDTITEIWNLVFMQFDRSEVEPGKFKLTPLPAPSVDTGMGLERITTVLQGVKSNYETDLLKDIVEFIAGLAGKKYEAETQTGFAMRVIADHARATAFSIADGILPGNEGRNYVIRKIMRRAIYQGRHTLALESLFFSKVTNFVVDQMNAAFPELEAQRGFIEKMVRLEEERFGATMTVGLQKFDGALPAIIEMNRRAAESIAPAIIELQRQTATSFAPAIIELQRQTAASFAPAIIELQRQTAASLAPAIIELQRQTAASLAPAIIELQRQTAASLVPALIDMQRQAAESAAPAIAEIHRQTVASLVPAIAALQRVMVETVRSDTVEAYRQAATTLLPTIFEAMQNMSRLAVQNAGPSIEALVRMNQLAKGSIAAAMLALQAGDEVERADVTQTLGEVRRIKGQTDETLRTTFKELARLYDTFGTPRDLIRVALEQQGEHLDEEGFNEQFDTALQELHESGTTNKSKSAVKTKAVHTRLAARVQSHFRGYDTTRADDARVLAALRGDEEVSELKEGQEGEVVLDQTPFYAESGGQVGDAGLLLGSFSMSKWAADQPAGTNSQVRVFDTYSPAQGLIVHKVRVEKGTLKVGDTVTAEVDVEKRDATRRNHTATHLMHAALREVLGTHVKQAGSVVAPTYLRFDFNHYQPLTAEEIKEIESLVNYHILRNEPVETNEMATEEAMRSGAMALFGEKYGEKVRVLSIKGAEDIFSRELCGGTHVRATGDIGLFKITSDESIASGVRRIRAVTGVDAFERFREAESILDRVTSGLRTSRTELPAQVERLQDELKKARRDADDLRMKIASGAISSASNGDESREVAGVRVVAREASGLDSAGMRQLSDTLLARIKSGVVVLGRSSDGKVSLIVRTSDDLTGRVPAGKVIKELAPMVGGKGGGKADMAEGGGTQADKLGEALEASYEIVERLLS